MEKQLNGLQLNRIYQRDCIEGMKMIPDGSVDLIIADPPYNTGEKGTKVNLKAEYGYNFFNQAWDKITDFDTFNREWIEQCYRVLKPNGSILVYGTFHNLFSVGYFIERTGLTVRAKYEWRKKNPPPNFSGNAPHFATESIIWATKGKSRTYNLHFAKKINGGKNIQNIIETALTPQREKKFGKFPCQKPLELTIKLIQLHSHKDDIILVPFCGSGSEAVAAEIVGRNFITFEREPAYIELANMRLDNTNEFKMQFAHLLED
ncbi:site-specific DNA-methyltransferase [Paenibacillus sp. FSL R5-0407]|uniref:DNA-methyltransferase n=1 Tax=Paenibacillus sp. FSL R5-0407 TaxID=2975320 RepID=UPI0030F8F5F0